MITAKQIQEAKIGDSLCDMHYGLQVHEDMGCSPHRASVGVSAADVLIERAMLVANRVYLNKMLVVVDVDANGCVTCAYIYDGRRAEIISFGFYR